MRPCRTPGCDMLVTNGYCTSHAATLEHTYRTGRPSRSVYQSRRWHALRRAVLRDHPLCVVCGMIATEVDHRTPIEDGGDPWARSGLAPMCHSCHAAKTSRDVRSRVFK